MTRTIPAVPAIVNAGVLLPSTTATQWAQTINLALNPPRCSVHLATGPGPQALATWFLLTWDTDDVDTDTIWQSAHHSRLQVPYAGTWLVTFNIVCTANSYPLIVNVRKNAAGSQAGGTSVGTFQGGTSNANGSGFATRFNAVLAANDYLEWFYEWPLGGGSPNLVAGIDTCFAQVRQEATS